MRLSRRGYGNFTNREFVSLADEELPDRTSGSVEYSYTKAFSLRIRGTDGGKGSIRKDGSLSLPSEYWYEITLTPRDVKMLLSKSLENPHYTEKMPDSEKKLWEVLLDLWEKRLKRQGRKRS